MNKLKRIGLTLAVGLVGFSIGKFTGPAKVEIKEVEKIVYRESTNVSRDKYKKETVLPDGTTIREEGSTTKKNTEIGVDKESEKLSKTDARPDWRLNVTYQPTLVTFQDQNITLDLQRRIIGEVYLGLSVSTQKTVGISLGVGF